MNCGVFLKQKQASHKRKLEKKTELSMQTDETVKGDNDKCFICERKEHKISITMLKILRTE
jgi:hypothetical protein